ncbi:hypothetical protein SESBI_43088 [Sesbania bispinosa]|nr:hypothetical protein SESBI_43088 [Sesbania bispinosa]
MNCNRKVCKTELAFRTLLPEKRNASSAEEPARNSGMWHIDSGIATQSKRSNIDNKRKTEKAEDIIIHLICWGPTWS